VTDPGRLDPALWRTVATFRVAALAYAWASFAVRTDEFERPLLACCVLVLMACWTLLLVVRQQPATWLLALDLAVAVGAQQASTLVLSDEAIAAGAPTLPVAWAAVPVAAWLFGGVRAVVLSREPSSRSGPSRNAKGRRRRPSTRSCCSCCSARSSATS
jgi:hypothetical protein